MRVLIAPDKFKGTLTAAAAARAIARGWHRSRTDDTLELMPVSDGGDGFGRVLAAFHHAQPVRTTTVDAAGQRRIVRWWWDAARKTAIIESAQVIGLAMLPPGKFHPAQLDTRGLAAVLRATTRRGARRCIVGLGGSATNDGGFGLARGLGWKFFDEDGIEIQQWTQLTELARIEAPREHAWPEQIIAAVDVRNPLLGARGCTRVFGPQKGLRQEDFAKCEAALARLAKVVRSEFGKKFATLSGAGAAGGLGFGLAAFAGAELESGIELVADAVGLEARLRRADMVITGEGCLDRSTFMGKGAGELAARCRKLGVPCIALGGHAEDRALLAKKFSHVGTLTDLTSPSNAKKQAKFWLERLATDVARKMNGKSGDSHSCRAVRTTRSHIS